MPAWPAIPASWLDRPVVPPRPEHDPRVRWLGALDAGPFRIWHKAYRSDFTQSRHAHATGSVDFNIAGGGLGSYLGRPRDSTPGAVEHYRADADHAFASGPSGIRVLHVIFRDDDASPIHAGAQRRPARDDPFEPDEGAAAGAAARLLRELHRPGPDSTLIVESLAHEVLAHARRWPAPATVGSRAIQRAAEILRAAVDAGSGAGSRTGLGAGHAPPSLADLAHEIDLHPCHLARAFRAAMGASPGEYARRLRVARAVKDLTTSDKPIAGVAGTLGFADQAHFTRWFTRITGISPAAYRRTLRSL